MQNVYKITMIFFPHDTTVIPLFRF